MRAISSPPASPPRARWPRRRWPAWPGASWQARLSWPIGRLRLERVDVAWAMFSLASLAAMLVFARWETVPFHFIWISLTLLYGFRVWAARPTMLVLASVMATTFAAILLDVVRGTEPPDELNEVPLMAAMFAVMVWHAQRRLAADRERQRMSEENMSMLAAQRRFLQDASHQLRTPITIALGHAELLAGELAGAPGQSDIQVVVGELSRLRRIGERLLVIAAAADPDFLRLEAVGLHTFTMEVIRRWRPAAKRRWQLGRVDEVAVLADKERLGLAVDALLENAVRHTDIDDVIRLSTMSHPNGRSASLVVEDNGGGIAAADLARIFDRFATGTSGRRPGRSRGTGLGLALTRAIARAHGGDVRVRSTPGAGTEFELTLPCVGGSDSQPYAAADGGVAPVGPGALSTHAPAGPPAGGRAERSSAGRAGGASQDRTPGNRRASQRMPR